MSVVRAAPSSTLYVVPTLGTRLEYLAQTLDSLQLQNDVCVVVVAPGTAESVRTMVAERGLIFLEEEGRGISSAINQGWRSYGDAHEFWAWIGDDDTLAPASAARATAALRARPRASMVYGRCAYVDETGRSLFVAHPSRLAAMLLRWGPSLVPQPGSVARASAVRTAGGLDENLRYAMDLDLFLRLRDVGPLHYVPVVLATFRWHDDSTTVVSSQASAEEARQVRRRTWSGRRSIGHVVQPLAMLMGRLLYRVHRRAR